MSGEKLFLINNEREKSSKTPHSEKIDMSTTSFNPSHSQLTT